MTHSDNGNNRLDRIESLVEANSRQIGENTSAINLLIRVTTQQQRNFEIMFTEIREMQSEIRGLQTENRRILEELQRRQNGGN